MVMNFWYSAPDLWTFGVLGMPIPPKPSPAIPTPAAHAAAATASVITTAGCKRTRSEENSLSDGDEPSKQRAKVETCATIGGDETTEQSQPQVIPSSKLKFDRSS